MFERYLSRNSPCVHAPDIENQDPSLMKKCGLLFPCAIGQQFLTSSGSYRAKIIDSST